RRRLRVLGRRRQQASSAARKLARTIDNLDHVSGLRSNPRTVARVSESLRSTDTILAKLNSDCTFLESLIRTHASWEWDDRGIRVTDVLPELLDQLCAEHSLSRERAYQQLAERICVVWSTLEKSLGRRLSRDEFTEVWGRKVTVNTDESDRIEYLF